jgi:hypothetical protein
VLRARGVRTLQEDDELVRTLSEDSTVSSITPLQQATPSRRIGLPEGGKRADGAAKRRQMQANPGHWRSLQDTSTLILTRGVMVAGQVRPPGARDGSIPPSSTTTEKMHPYLGFYESRGEPGGRATMTLSAITSYGRDSPASTCPENDVDNC